MQEAIVGQSKDLLIKRSCLNAEIHRDLEVFTPSDFLAGITQHIPDKGAPMVRCYGWYSNKMRAPHPRGDGASSR